MLELRERKLDVHSVSLVIEPVWESAPGSPGLNAVLHRSAGSGAGHDPPPEPGGPDVALRVETRPEALSSEGHASG
ncbi:hypothetical protein [Candidatus Poriferisodalis sp.]|uniref:hypothetical protein n=1 Tax=Candidatus Poriferisodalis sp. TaxID=3101277 RepID=UPI003AF94609